MVNIELPFNQAYPLLGLSPERMRIKKTQGGNPALQQYLPQPTLGSNKNVCQQRKAQRRSGPCTQWNITPIKKIYNFNLETKRK